MHTISLKKTNFQILDFHVYGLQKLIWEFLPVMKCHISPISVPSCSSVVQIYAHFPIILNLNSEALLQTQMALHHHTKKCLEIGIGYQALTSGWFSNVYPQQIKEDLTQVIIWHILKFLSGNYFFCVIGFKIQKISEKAAKLCVLTISLYNYFKCQFLKSKGFQIKWHYSNRTFHCFFIFLACLGIYI